MTRLRARHIPLLAAFLLAGCHDPLTQVVLVIQSDLKPPTEVDGMDVAAIQGPYAPQVQPFFNNTGIPLGQFPLSVGFTSGNTDSFSITIRLFRGTTQSVNPTIVVSRTVTDIHFVDQQTKMFVLPMLKACACQGSTCPTPGSNPDCDNLDNPPVVPFDPAVAPPSSGKRGGGQVIINGGADGGIKMTMP
jgi:hypothetical protein